MINFNLISRDWILAALIALGTIFAGYKLVTYKPTPALTNTQAAQLLALQQRVDVLEEEVTVQIHKRLVTIEMDTKKHIDVLYGLDAKAKRRLSNVEVRVLKLEQHNVKQDARLQELYELIYTVPFGKRADILPFVISNK